MQVADGLCLSCRSGGGKLEFAVCRERGKMRCCERCVEVVTNAKKKIDVIMFQICFRRA